MAALTRIRPHAAGRPAALLAGLLALAIAGCVNPFKPATPEPPRPGGLIADYSTPNKLLLTLESAMEAKGPAGAVAWIDAMAVPTGSSGQGFTATNDPIMLDRWLATSTVPPPNPWSVELERTFFSNFIATMFPSYEFIMKFERDNDSIDDETDESDGAVLLHRHYYIAATLPDEARVIAIGYVDLSLVKYDGNWHILQWKDRIDPRAGLDPTSDVVPLGWRRLEFH